MDAIILAGGETPPALSHALGASTAEERALLKVDGRAAILYVLESLQQSAQVQQIAVVGLPSTLRILEEAAPQVTRVEAQSTLADNVLAGMNTAETPQVLICTCDVPLVTAQTWQEFLNQVQVNNFEAAYPIARRETVEKSFLQGKRTYATLRDGTFTGGNAFVLPRGKEAQLRQLIDAGFRARKNPLGLARLLGTSFVVKAVAKKLSIDDLEKKMSQLLDCRAGAVEMQDASIAFDIDKKEDYDLAQEVLQLRN